MSRRVHVHLDIYGVLTSWPAKGLLGLFKDQDGNDVDPAVARSHLIDELQRGHEVLPIGEPCEGFDYIKGCPGHEITTDQP